MNEAKQAFYESLLEMNEMLFSVGKIEADKYEQVKAKYTAVLTSSSDSKLVFPESDSLDSTTDSNS